MLESAVFLFPGTDTGGDGLDGFVLEFLPAFAGVVTLTLFELEEEAGHTQWAKRGGERLVTGGSQFSGIEEFSFHRSLLV